MSKSSKGKSTKAKETKSAKKADSGGSESKAAEKTTSTKADGGATTDAGTKSDSGSKSDGGAGKEKSARESIGGKEGVHYGYFSSVRTPAYRSGWDEIWGNGSSDGAKKKAPARRKAKARKRAEPVTLGFDIDDFPAEVQKGLAEMARNALKKRRLSYDKHAKSGAVDWRIEVRIDR